MKAKTVEQRTAEIEEKRLNFDTLLEPYREGGTPEHPVRRTVGSIVDYLLNKRKYPKEVVGASLLAVFLELKAGRSFPGDGTYGSPGRDLVTYIRHNCDRINQERLTTEATAFADSLLSALDKLRKPPTLWQRVVAWFKRPWRKQA